MEKKFREKINRLIKNILEVRGLFKQTAACAKKSPVFWVIEESEEEGECCLKVKFYNKKNQLIHQKNFKNINLKYLDESAIRKLNQLKSDLIRKTC